MQAPAPQIEPRLIISSLAGTELFEFTPIPPTVGDVKCLIAESGYLPIALQRLLRQDLTMCDDDDETLNIVDQEMLLVQDDTPLWSWDLEGNPSRGELDIESNIIKCPNLRTDYTNVVTREPIATGLHYFEFHLCQYGDEQWCGLTTDKDMAGPEYAKAIPSKKGWMYYTGRGRAAIEALGRHLKECKFAERSNSVIGMLVDCSEGSAAFHLNGEIQGACEIPKNTRLWVLTHVDDCSDHVELRKPSLMEAPPSNIDALKGALLDVTQGCVMNRDY